MKEIILQAKSRLHASARRIRRYLRTPSSFTPGDVTALPMRNDGSLRRRPERMFNIPGAFSQAPEAKLFGVTETTERFDLPPHGDYDVLQGGCTDGRFAYLILENQKMAKSGQSPHSECVICKVDMDDWQITAKSASLPLHHGNDITYNPRTGKLIAVHCYGRPNDVSFIDPETLQITETKEYFHSVYGIAYNPTRNQYVMAIRGGYDFAVFDSRFGLLRYIKGVDTRFVKQGIDCDDNYIYFATSEENAIVCYDWTGQYRGVFAVRGCDREAENIFHRGDQWYIAYNLGGHRGGCVYKVEFDRDILAG